VLWLAGSRGELLALGPLLQAVRRRAVPHPDAGGAIHLLAVTGEQGTALEQALDALGLRPDEAAPLCHPGDEPAARLQQMLGVAEAFARQRKATRVVFMGCGATALGAALACHGRGTPGLWLRPADPDGQLGRLRLEAGNARLIEACAPLVTAWTWPATPLLPEDLPADAPAPPAWPMAALEDEIPGLRPATPVALVAANRREWGIKQDVTALLARATAAWARRHPELDWLILGNLNARMVGPLAALRDRPTNLLAVPPLPYAVYRALLARSRWMLTDSPRMADEARRHGVATALLADAAPESGARRDAPGATPIAFATPATLEQAPMDGPEAAAGDAELGVPIDASLPTPFAPPPLDPSPLAAALSAVQAWLARPANAFP
jgi:hypothetical protein